MRRMCSAWTGLISTAKAFPPAARPHPVPTAPQPYSDPVHELETVWAKLKEGGYLFIETGNVPDVHTRWLKQIPHFMYRDHLFFFGQKP
jgi:hypothetical protein